MRLKTRDREGLLLVLVLQRRAGSCSPAIIRVMLTALFMSLHDNISVRTVIGRSFKFIHQ